MTPEQIKMLPAAERATYIQIVRFHYLSSLRPQCLSSFCLLADDTGYTH
jgi:hypothetical protein